MLLYIALKRCGNSLKSSSHKEQQIPKAAVGSPAPPPPAGVLGTDEESGACRLCLMFLFSDFFFLWLGVGGVQGYEVVYKRNSPAAGPICEFRCRNPAPSQQREDHAQCSLELSAAAPEDTLCRCLVSEL